MAKNKMNNLYKNKIKIWASIFAIVILVIASFGVASFSENKYSDQNLNLTNIPPIFKGYKIDSDYTVFLHKDLYPVLVTNKGKVLKRLFVVKTKNKKDFYFINNKELVIDYSKITDFKNIDYKNVKLILNGKLLTKADEKLLWNQTNIFGTDNLGRDLYIRVFQGVKISLIIGFTSSVVNLIIGVIYGGVAGYKGGKTDDVMFSILNIINSIPQILIVVLLSLFFNQSILAVILTIGLVYWVGMARQVRAQVMAIKEQDFILAVKLIDVPEYKIIFKHIVPNIKETILVVLVVNIQNAIFTEAFLSFLGLGLPAPIASLGTLINNSIGVLKSSPYQLIIPSIALVVVLILLENVANLKLKKSDKEYLWSKM